MVTAKNIADLKEGSVVLGYTLQGSGTPGPTGITWPAQSPDGEATTLHLYASSSTPSEALGTPLKEIVSELSSDVIADTFHKIAISLARLLSEQIKLRSLVLEGIWVQSVPDGFDEPRLQLMFEAGAPEATDDIQRQLGWALYRLVTDTPEPTQGAPRQNDHPIEVSDTLSDDPYVAGFDAIIEKSLRTDPEDQYRSMEALAGAFASLRRAISRMRNRPAAAKTAFTSPPVVELIHGTDLDDDDDEEEATTALELQTGALIEGHRLIKLRHRVSTGELWDTLEEDTGEPAMLMMSLTAFAGQQLMDDIIAQELIGRMQRRVALADPGLVEVLQVLQKKGRDFIVSVIEPFHGTPFSELVDTVDTKTIAQVLERACSTLTYMHEQKHLHRGFGINSLFIAYPESELDESTVKVLDSELSPVVKTEEDSLLAMVRRLPPEALARLEGAKVTITGAGDQWCVGLTLYELLTGQHPFDQAEGPELIRAILDDPPPPLQYKTRFQTQPYLSELEAITMRCLQKEPTDRFKSMGELASAFLKLTSS